MILKDWLVYKYKREIEANRQDSNNLIMGHQHITKSSCLLGNNIKFLYHMRVAHTNGFLSPQDILALFSLQSCKQGEAA